MTDKEKDPSGTLYDRDTYAWAMREAELLRRRDFAQLDLANVIEEVESIARWRRDRWESHITWAIEMLLALEYGLQVTQDTRNRCQRELWQSRHVIEQETRRSPSLVEMAEAAVFECWRWARPRAIDYLELVSGHLEAPPRGRVGLWDQLLPECCPYSYVQIVDEEFVPRGGMAGSPLGFEAGGHLRHN